MVLRFSKKLKLTSSPRSSTRSSPRSSRESLSENKDFLSHEKSTRYKKIKKSNEDIMEEEELTIPVEDIVDEVITVPKQDTDYLSDIDIGQYFTTEDIKIDDDYGDEIIIFIKILIRKILLEYIDIEYYIDYKDILVDYVKYLIDLFRHNILYITAELNFNSDKNLHVDILEKILNDIFLLQNNNLIIKYNETDKETDKEKYNIFIQNSETNAFYKKYSESSILLKKVVDSDKTTGGFNDENYASSFHKITCENIEDAVVNYDILRIVYKNFILFSYFYIKETLKYTNLVLNLHVNIFDKIIGKDYIKYTYILDNYGNDYNYKFINKIQTILELNLAQDGHYYDLKNNIDRISEFNALLDTHYQYISTLKFEDKCAINNYTFKYNKVYSDFILYKNEYESTGNNIDTDVSKNFYTKYIKTNSFGKGFYHEIIDVISIKDDKKLSDKKKLENKSRLENKLREDENSEENSELYGYDISVINGKQWNIIIDKYKERLNSIILNIKDISFNEDFYIYRGSSNYMDFEQDGIYQSTKFNSFSLSFEIAKKFCELNHGNVIYRLKIPARTEYKILFLAPISYFPDELEVLTSSDQKFKYINTDTIISYNVYYKNRVICPNNKGHIKESYINIINLEYV